MPQMRAVCSSMFPSSLEPLRRVLVVMACALLFCPARAYGNAPVAIAIHGQGNEELARKLTAEVGYAGFAVAANADVDSGPGSTTRAAVVLRVLSSERIQLVFSQPEDGSATESHILDMLPGEGDAFPLRAVEFVRARLVDLGWQVPAVDVELVPAAETPQPSATPASTPPELEPAASAPTPAEALGADAGAANRLPGSTLARRGAWLGIDAAGLTVLGGFDVSPRAGLGVRAELGEYWGVSLHAAMPLGPAEFSRVEGQAQLSWYAASAGAHLRWQLDEAWFTHLGVEGGASMLRLKGQALDGFAGRKERLYVGTVAASLGVGRRLLDWLRVRAFVSPGLVAPRPIVRFDGREVAAIGRVFASAGVSLEAGFDWGAAQP